VFPIVQRCAEQFNLLYSNITVIVESPPVGTSGGIRLLGEKSIDIACASRAVKTSEEDSFPNMTFSPTIIAYDGVAIIIHKDLYAQGVQNLSLLQVKGIYNGSITNWSQILPSINGSIQVNQRETGSGTKDTFMEAVFHNTSAQIISTAMSWSSNQDLKTAVENNSHAIGYVGLGFIDEKTPSVTLNGIPISEETIKDKTYPINRVLYLYLDGTPSWAENLFLQYVLGNAGQFIVEDEGFISI
jgi:phosphate transport system substrate-binding protein